MKKFFFSIILSLLFSAFAHAQWTTQNGYTFATNPIGIGTMTPAAKLQVFASATQYTNIDGSAISLVSSNAATPLLSLTGSSTADLLNLTNGSNSLIVKSTGNVGLGTKNNILLSNGIMSIESGAAAGVNNGLTLNSAHDYGSGIGTAASALSFTRNRTGDASAVSYNAQISGGNTSETTSQGGYLAFSTSSDGLSLTEAMRIFKNGNIGIGTTTPTAKLQVFASPTQYTNIDGSGISLVSSNATTPLLSLTGSSTADLLNLTNGSNSLIVKSTGNVGLGTKNNILLSNGIMSIESGAAAGINNGLTLNSAHDYGSGAGTAASALSFTRNRTGDISAVSYNAQISGGNTSETTSQGGYLAFSTSSDGLSLTEAMRIFKNGNIGIGTANPLNYKLGVNGSLIATSVTVKMYSDWGDYVFKKDYHLPLLSEVKTYIDKNHHLPEIPSAQQIAKEGLNLGEINKLLVKKVEELTLYLIEKDNKQKEQDNLLAQQQRQINELIQQVARLSKTNANK